MPDPDRDPSGRELIDEYLAPLAAHPAIAPHLRFGERVLSVTRQGMDRVPSTGREQRPFEIVTVDADGSETRHLARAIIDASGTWDRPNPAGASGVPANGERTAAARISYGIPDVCGNQRERFAGRRVMVIGSGHSAMDSILGLDPAPDRTSRRPRSCGRCGRRRPSGPSAVSTTISSPAAARSANGRRRPSTPAPFGSSPRSASTRSRLGDGTVAVTGETDDGDDTIEVDEVIVATGFRPDFSAMSELRLDLHPWLESSRELGPLIDPNEHSCGTVPPHGERRTAAIRSRACTSSG